MNCCNKKFIAYEHIFQCCCVFVAFAFCHVRTQWPTENCVIYGFKLAYRFALLANRFVVICTSEQTERSSSEQQQHNSMRKSKMVSDPNPQKTKETWREKKHCFESRMLNCICLVWFSCMSFRQKNQIFQPGDSKWTILIQYSTDKHANNTNSDKETFTVLRNAHSQLFHWRNDQYAHCSYVQSLARARAHAHMKLFPIYLSSWSLFCPCARGLDLHPKCVRTIVNFINTHK